MRAKYFGNSDGNMNMNGHRIYMCHVSNHEAVNNKVLYPRISFRRLERTGSLWRRGVAVEGGGRREKEAKLRDKKRKGGTFGP